MASHDEEDKFELLCDDLLELILLRLDPPVSLVLAASVCKRWRRVVADAGFLRRIRSLHRPTVAGHYSTGHPQSFESYRQGDKRVPFFLPSPSVAFGVSHLSPDFLGSYNEILDSCGTLLLLQPRRYSFAGITVYEPLTRRCRIIDDPPAPSEYGGVTGAYLLAGGDGSDDEATASMSSFRVACTFYEHDGGTQAGVLLVSGHSGGGDDNGWRFARLDGTLLGQSTMISSFVGRVGGSLHWLNLDGKVHVLNGITMEASSFMFPDMDMWNSSVRPYVEYTHNYGRNLRVVDCGGGAARIVCLAGRDLLVVFSRPRGGGEWALEKSVRAVRLPMDTLPLVPERREGYHLRFMSGFGSFVAAGAGFVVFAPTEYCRLVFHMDLETEVITLQLNGGIYSPGLQFPCELPWPPAIRACVHD